MDSRYVKENIEIVVVNYNTPDLVKRLLDSWIKFDYTTVQIHIVDGSDTLEFQEKIKEVCRGIELTQLKYNIHHGPGLDFGIRQSEKEYLFLMDSDSYFTKVGLFDRLQFPENHFGIGMIVVVNNAGFVDPAGRIQYLHPNCCLISREKYLSSNPLIKHGAPFISTMANMKFFIKDEWKIISEYVYWGVRGTAARFGYWGELIKGVKT